jgi:spermidine/putrescine transport system substrate-binding protein
MSLALSRREFLRRAGTGVGVISLGGLLAACGEEVPAGSAFTSEPAGILNFANWSLYIDKATRVDGSMYSPTLARFTAKTGIQVNYRQVIPDADWFFQQIEPRLAAGEPTGWDVMVITNGITLTKLKELGYLVELPTGLRPNFDAHAGEFVKDPAYDPGNRYTMAWQSGITGIAYDPQVTGGAVTSLQDLFDPKYQGKVGMFGDIIDMPNLALLAIGVLPEDSTPDDWTRAAALLEQQRDSGILKGYYLQNYIPALKQKEIGITMAWSGDIFAAKLLGKIPEEIEFVVPDDGALLWTDAMCIPKGATHLADAIAFMDYVYEPRAAAQIAQFVNYITPVPDAQPEIERMADQAQDPAEQARLREVAASSLVFPTPEVTRRLFTYRELASDEEATIWDQTFRGIYAAS